MKEKTGTVFSIAKENAPITGCTVSREITEGSVSVQYFALAKNTDISAEMFPDHKMIIMADGKAKLYLSDGQTREISIGECILTPVDVPVGIRTSCGAVYAEITVRRNSEMNELVKSGEVFRLAELLPYQNERIVNMDVVHNDGMKFALMAFDGGTGLSEHAAPGEAIVFALEGSAVITYEGREYTIHAGENFCFARGGRHAIRAEERFKMGLLLIFEK